MESEGLGKEDESVFEITDFTNATPWESFVSAIENILYQWGLTNTGDNEGSFKQHHKAERINFVKWKFVISFHISTTTTTSRSKSHLLSEDWPSGMQQLMNVSNDFPPKAHHISRWYGLDQFILIAPDEHGDALLSEAQIKLLLSSVSLAISNTQCTTPVFIQIQKNWRHMYVGVCEGCGLRTNFSMIHLHTTPLQFNHLSGLLDLFKSKLKSPILKPDPVDVAARLTYVLRHWSIDEWPVEPLGDIDGLLTAASFSSLPTGASSDPIEELHVSAVWPHMSEETVVDNATQSDFNPWHAKRWTVRTRVSDNPSLLLYGLLDGAMRVCYRQETVIELLGNKLLHDDTAGVASSDYAHALTRLTEPSPLSSSSSSSPLFSSVVYSASQRLEFGSDVRPISEQELECVLQYIFPDSSTGTSTSQNTKPTKPNPFSSDDPPAVTLSPRDGLLHQLKSAPMNSFTGRLARALCVANHEYGIRAFAHIWFEVLIELRYRWEHGITIEGLNCDIPDMSCCLLHQKLQMLNCCILHKVSHAQWLSRSATSPPTTSDSSIFHTPNSSLSFSQRQDSMREKDKNDEPSSLGSRSSSSSDEFFEAQESIQTDPNSSLQKSESRTTDRSGPHSQVSPLNVERQESQSSLGSPSMHPRKVDLQPVEGGNDPLSLLSREEEEEEDHFAGQRVERAAKEEEEEGTTERSGALRPYKDLVLIATNEPMYEPVVQEPTPMTEDMLWEQQDVLSRLGTSQEAAHVRAKMQSLSLLSDMQAFKAANPGCLLEDFVRWYSPRDWITEDEEEDEEKDGEIGLSATGGVTQTEVIGEQSHSADGWDTGWGGDEDLDAMLETGSNEENEPCQKRTRYVNGHLSCRMRQPSNIWVTRWDEARPIPIHRQKRLFDDTKEAEKVLHHLAALTPGELTVMLLPVILHCSITALQKRLKAWPLPTVESILQDAMSVLCTVHRPSLDSLPVYQECLALLQEAERILATALSLQLKLKQGVEFGGEEWEGERGAKKEVNTCIEVLLDSDELVIENPSNSHIGMGLRGLLIAHQDVEGPNTFPPPAGREFILRTTLPRPNAFSRTSPQRLFCVLTRDEMRLAGAFTEDTILT